MIDSTSTKSRRHYHNHAVDISKWMKDEISTVLNTIKAEIIFLDVTAEFVCKLGKSQIVNSVSLKYMDKIKNEMVVLENYSSLNKEYDNKKSTWITNQIKDMECRAFLKFAPVATGSEEREYKEPSKIKVKKNDIVTKNKNLKLSLIINAELENLMEFLTEEKFIRLWILKGNYQNGTATLDNVQIKNILKENKTITMEFKLIEWDSFTPVIITLINMGVDTKVDILQKDIPISCEGAIKAQWIQRIFTIICNLFGFCIKKVE